MIAYASRTLTKSESNYSVIQRECLAAVFGMKQFRHYLLGCFFTLMTDHAPLQWLSTQKMEGLLQRWALLCKNMLLTLCIGKEQRTPMLIHCHATQCLSQPQLQSHHHNLSVPYIYPQIFTAISYCTSIYSHLHYNSLQSLDHMISPLQGIKELRRHCSDLKSLPIGWEWPRMLLKCTVCQQAKLPGLLYKMGRGSSLTRSNCHIYFSCRY